MMISVSNGLLEDVKAYRNSQYHCSLLVVKEEKMELSRQ